MTYITDALAEPKAETVPQAIMAIVDENGIEIPFTEADILRTLKSMSEQKFAASGLTDIDDLMEHVYAARSIA